ncbi:ROK family protein [Globicatella sanguinis]|uniref:ROK family protein n=1 Tax=Globicatella sanguinis TaxID=13076 RepID=UPI000823FF79|nr:ROK family protein [Globicatella sanguinis]
MIIIKVLCIDIGGTFIKYGIFSISGDTYEPIKKVKTEVSINDNHILKQVTSICKKVIQEHPTISGIAIASAGVVNPDSGVIEYAGYTIPKYQGTQFKKIIENELNIPCTILNDVNAALLGEYWKYHQDDNKNNLVCLTLGTGIGAAIMINGKLYQGHSYTAGEIGYLPIDGHYLQDIASASFLTENATIALRRDINGEEFFKLLISGNPTIRKIYDTFIKNLAQGLLIIQYLLNPDLIILGGGILAQDKLIIPDVVAEMSNISVHNHFIQSNIVPAKLGNKAGLLGALYYFKTENNL